MRQWHDHEYRGAVAVILAVGFVMIMVIAVAVDKPLSEVGGDVMIAVLGAIIGALAGFISGRTINGGVSETKPLPQEKPTKEEDHAHTNRD